MDIRKLMVAVCIRSNSDFKEACSGWTLADYSNAMCGEAGEVANVIKKYRRGDFADYEVNRFIPAIGSEIADVISYALLLAAHCGISPDDMAIAIADKFNEVSSRVNSGMRLMTNGDLSLHNEVNSERDSDKNICAVRVPISNPEKGMIVRYADGPTALVQLESPHAGGWHGVNCLGGIRFVHGKLFLADESDMEIWNARSQDRLHDS